MEFGDCSKEGAPSCGPQTLHAKIKMKRIFGEPVSRRLLSQDFDQIIRGIQVFVAVVEFGSMSEAGRQGGFTAASASKWIATLEERLGVSLLARSTRRIELTEAGKSYYPRAVDVLRALEAANEEAAAFREKPIGTLSLFVERSCLIYWLPKYLQKFRQEYGDITIHITSFGRFDSSQIHNFDLTITVGNSPDTSFPATIIGHRELAHYGSRSEPNAVELTEGLLRSFGVTDSGANARDSVDVDDFETAKVLTLAGFGSAKLFTDMVAARDLELIDETPPVTIPVIAVSSSAQPPKKTRLFLELFSQAAC